MNNQHLLGPCGEKYGSRSCNGVKRKRYRQQCLTCPPYRKDLQRKEKRTQPEE